MIGWIECCRSKIRVCFVYTSAFVERDLSVPPVDWIAFWIRLQVCDSVGTVFEKRCSPKLPLSSHSALDPPNNTSLSTIFFPSIRLLGALASRVSRDTSTASVSVGGAVQLCISRARATYTRLLLVS